MNSQVLTDLLAQEIMLIAWTARTEQRAHGRNAETRRKPLDEDESDCRSPQA
jgi:hypothetical protein